MIKNAQFVLSRLIEAALLLVGVLLLVGDTLLWAALWDLLAVLYLAIRIARVRAGKRAAGNAWLRSALGPRLGLLFTLFTSVVGISAGLSIVVGVDDPDPAMDLANKLVAVPAVLLAWAILHFGYAERYARVYFAALPEEVLVFPGTPSPTYADFAYFAFTVGTTFAVSDVETQGSAVRARVLAHSVLSFVYNTATLGIAIGVVTGK